MGYDQQTGFNRRFHKCLATLIKTRLDNPEDYAGDSGAARAKREEAEWEFVVNGGEGGGTEDEYNPPPRWEPWAAPGASISNSASVTHGGDYANVPPPVLGAGNEEGDLPSQPARAGRLEPRTRVGG